MMIRGHNFLHWFHTVFVPKYCTWTIFQFMTTLELVVQLKCLVHNTPSKAAAMFLLLIFPLGSKIYC